MASITERKGKYRAIVRRKGIQKTATFNSYIEAKKWANELEMLIQSGEYTGVPKITFEMLLARYFREVSVHKRGKREEQYRILRLSRGPLGKVMVHELTKAHFREWQNKRLQEVSSGSVLRERTTISAILTKAVQWDYIKENPLRTLEKPRENPVRTRRYSESEIEALTFVSGYDPAHLPLTQINRAGAAMLFAIETAMRAGEICNLTWDAISFEKRTAFLPYTKNGHSRTVPLSPKAIEILQNLALIKSADSNSVFQTNVKNLDANFRKLKERAGLKDADLHFHDTRREALTRLAQKFTVMELAKISGHRDLSILQNTYYVPDISELANKLW